MEATVMTHTLLVVEDDLGIREAIAINLEKQGYTVLQACNGKEALDIVTKETIHLAIVDIMMPEMDGSTFTMHVRMKHNFPIIFLSAKSEEVDKVQGLNLGADDYMTKPFSSIELLARVRSHLRRYEQTLDLHAQLSRKTNPKFYQVGGLVLMPELKHVEVDGESVHLTPKEYQILEHLMKHPGHVFSSDALYEAVWQETAISSETIMVHIRKIREKIEIDPKNPRYLKVVWGVGYKIEKDTE